MPSASRIAAVTSSRFRLSAASLRSASEISLASSGSPSRSVLATPRISASTARVEAERLLRLLEGGAVQRPKRDAAPPVDAASYHVAVGQLDLCLPEPRRGVAAAVRKNGPVGAHRDVSVALASEADLDVPRAADERHFEVCDQAERPVAAGGDRERQLARPLHALDDLDDARKRDVGPCRGIKGTGRRRRWEGDDLGDVPNK